MQIPKLAVFISGSGSNLQAIIDSISRNDLNAEITCVISNNPQALGLERARKANIASEIIDHKLFNKREQFDQEAIRILSNYKVDYIILAGFMRILSKVFIKEFEGRILNIHPSLLPKYPGLNTHQKVLENNDKFHGITIHFVDESLDGGPICAQERFAVNTYDINKLIEKVHELEHKLYPRIIDLVSSGKIKFENGKVHFKDEIKKEL
tara:strand:- start:76790 stop:77416 length:627 start_codon:yes stop_codon:yes gene_type:complete